ncbi:MAG: M1 family metallopeptidase [Erythrobacter sp.]|jgi:aminopeptidase N
MRSKTFCGLLLAGAALFTPLSLAAQEAPDPAVLALGTVPRGQLGDGAVPQAYRLDTWFDPSSDSFRGHTEIDVTLARATKFLDLHGNGLKVTRALALAGGREYVGAWTDTDSTGVARLVFAEELPAGKATLSFDYAGGIASNPAGLFRAQVGGEWYGWSQFESTDARAAFPSFDQPGFKTPFTVTIRTRPGEVAVSNAPEVSSTLEDGWQVHRFAPTLPLPTYLVAMMAGPFAVAEGLAPPTAQRAEPLPLRIVSEQTNKDKLAFALEHSKSIVALLEDYFGQAFPYPKLDQITSPLMPGAMENAGADLYNDAILVLDEGAPVGQKGLFGTVVAHELAHQWFGDLVTPAWWDDIWLNESFANWMGFTIGGAWRPGLGIADGALGEGFQAMSTDELLAGRPIHEAIPTNDRIDSAFDGITYGKGGHVVSMIAAFMGPDKFRDGVRRYMAAHRYGNATSSDFFAAMAQAAGDPRITQAMMGFTDQQGVPLVTVSGGEGHYTVTQSRYAPVGTSAPDTRWGVPVCMRRGAARKCQLLAAASDRFDLVDKGVLMPNAGGTGYYRFDLPAAEWERLIAIADRLDGPEAIALADSLDASFRAGRATPAQVLALAQKLSANPDSNAAGIALSGLGAMRRSGVIDAEAQEAYRAWVGHLVRADFARLGLDPRLGAYAGADLEDVQQRERVVGNLLLARDPAVGKVLTDAARAYLAGDDKALDPAFMGAAFDALIEAGGLEAAKTLADKALASDDPLFRPTALRAITGSGKAAIARWVLDEFDDSRLRPSEKRGRVFGVSSAPETRELGYDWLVAHLDEMLQGSSGIFLATRIPGVASGFCSVERADEVAARFRPLLAGTPGALSLERTIERVRNCAALKAARGAEMSAALKALGGNVVPQ